MKHLLNDNNAIIPVMENSLKSRKRQILDKHDFEIYFAGIEDVIDAMAFLAPELVYDLWLEL